MEFRDDIWTCFVFPKELFTAWIDSWLFHCAREYSLKKTPHFWKLVSRQFKLLCKVRLSCKILQGTQLLAEQNTVNNFISSTTSGSLLHYLVMNVFNRFVWRLIIANTLVTSFRKAEGFTDCIAPALSASQTAYLIIFILFQISKPCRKQLHEKLEGQSQSWPTECWSNLQFPSLDRADEGSIRSVFCP